MELRSDKNVEWRVRVRPWPRRSLCVEGLSTVRARGLVSLRPWHRRQCPTSRSRRRRSETLAGAMLAHTPGIYTSYAGHLAPRHRRLCLRTLLASWSVSFFAALRFPAVLPRTSWYCSTSLRLPSATVTSVFFDSCSFSPSCSFLSFYVGLGELLSLPLRLARRENHVNVSDIIFKVNSVLGLSCQNPSTASCVTVVHCARKPFVVTPPLNSNGSNLRFCSGQ